MITFEPRSHDDCDTCDDIVEMFVTSPPCSEPTFPNARQNEIAKRHAIQIVERLMPVASAFVRHSLEVWGPDGRELMIKGDFSKAEEDVARSCAKEIMNGFAPINVRGVINAGERDWEVASSMTMPWLYHAVCQLICDRLYDRLHNIRSHDRLKTPGESVLERALAADAVTVREDFERKNAILEAMEMLPEPQRTIGRMIRHGNSRQEIAVELGVSQSTISRWWKEGRRLLRDMLDDIG